METTDVRLETSVTSLNVKYANDYSYKKSIS